MLNFIKRDNILKKVNSNHFVLRLLIYFFCITGLALLYNLIFVPYNLVIGGVGGMAIVINKFTGLSTSLMTVLITLLFLFISFFTIGKQKTLNSLVGALVYPFLVTVTAPIANYVSIKIDSYLFLVIVASVIYGTFYGIIYKIGYSTGGTDILLKVINHYKKMSMALMSIYLNVGIVLLSGFLFGITSVIYGVICLILCNLITDFVLLGNRDSKLCFIKTSEHGMFEKILKNYYGIGYTILKSSGGIDKRKRVTIFCIVPSEYYYDFRMKLQNLDQNAFLISYNSYEVMGGYRNKIIPF